MKKLTSILIVALFTLAVFYLGRTYEKKRINKRYIETFDPASDIECLYWGYIVKGDKAPEYYIF